MISHNSTRNSSKLAATMNPCLRPPCPSLHNLLMVVVQHTVHTTLPLLHITPTIPRRHPLLNKIQRALVMLGDHLRLRGILSTHQLGPTPLSSWCHQTNNDLNNKPPNQPLLPTHMHNLRVEYLLEDAHKVTRRKNWRPDTMIRL